jgi:hypothetical protein
MVTKVFHGIGMEFTFFGGFGIELMLAKVLKYFLDVILGGIQGMEHYSAKMLESCQSICETLGHKPTIH